ncbi:class I SAM-dependent methyltransferase [Tamlana fucoidanivorans]|uniref:Class I SAM-dependent methyltransferase n=1 Tax=Allotamlana fucoidanivorans TaxID=2583814 RepID=A0A5C4SNN1_9FLAO|nr:class I SAM-dependent methyltransferase [Tamlana fucoidanivorans]TNJ45785.1 class I SAM-dependent methyltransferase [Tamlana fucoidanivorans]
MLYQVKQYLKFLIASTNQHGVHSPFVFNLVTQCFYDKKSYTNYHLIEQYKNTLRNNKSTIKITDLGAGSQRMNQHERLICDMAKHAGTPLKRAKLLYRLVQYLQPKEILELGSSLGIATHAMALGNPKAKITSIEGCPNTATFARLQLGNLNNSSVEIINQDFYKAITKRSQNQYNLIFFDGNHQKEATLNYFKTLLPTVNNDTVFIFDDIHWSKEMTQAWDIIKKHPKVTVTIDTFFWGFVFFRKEQAKEHFTIRT